MKFHFGTGSGEGINVRAGDRYRIQEDPQREPSYGFLTEENRYTQERLQIPGLNSGFTEAPWYERQPVSGIGEDTQGCYVFPQGAAKEEDAGRFPCTFVTDVPQEGNYQVTVTLYASQDCREAKLFLGRRRLAWMGNLKSGEYKTGTFYTNICPTIPRFYTEVMEDTTLDVTLLGAGLHLQALTVTEADCPTVYIAGDSTVTDQFAEYPYYPGSSYCGWGQMLPFYAGQTMAVSNHAHSGLTTESFRAEGHYQVLLDRIREKDLCLLQFGHNDQKLPRLLADGGYADNLRRYFCELREKGAVPVLVTPLARNSWQGRENRYSDLLKEYADSCIRIAAEERVALLDLHRFSMELVISKGKERVKDWFFPGDYTHSNDYGAFLYAGYLYRAMLETGVIQDETPQNSGDDGPEGLAVWKPPHPLPTAKPPVSFQQQSQQADPLASVDRLQDRLTRIEAVQLVVNAMHFFPANVYNDEFTDVIGHEPYAGVLETACRNELLPQAVMQESCFCPDRTITGKEFLEIVKNGYLSRKSALPKEQDEDGQKLLQRAEEAPELTRGEAVRICRLFPA